MNHSTAMDLIREANPVPNPAGMDVRQAGISGWIGKLTIGVLAALVLGAGASWAATGKDPVDLVVNDLIEQGATQPEIRAVEHDAQVAPASTMPAPEVPPGAVRIPAGPVAAPIVEYCFGVQKNGEQAIDQNPQCAAVLLRDAGVIPGGTFGSNFIEDKYEDWRERQ